MLVATWNPWHGCTKTSAGCAHCYVYRRDAEFGRDASVVHKTASFDLPLRKNRQKEYKLQPDGDYVYTCFTSDLFHPDADEWRTEAWSTMSHSIFIKPVTISGEGTAFTISSEKTSTNRRQRPGWILHLINDRCFRAVIIYIHTSGGMTSNDE